MVKIDPGVEEAIRLVEAERRRAWRAMPTAARRLGKARKAYVDAIKQAIIVGDWSQREIAEQAQASRPLVAYLVREVEIEQRKMRRREREADRKAG